MARKSRKQTAAPMPAPSLYVHVALYIRLSVEDNKKRGCSVENQKLVLNDFLSDKPDFVVYDTYIDNGATGTNFHRPGFQQMLSDIEAGHINCVIVTFLLRIVVHRLFFHYGCFQSIKSTIFIQIIFCHIAVQHLIY